MAASSDVKVKKELDEDLKEVSHEHRFSVQFQSRDNKQHEVNCRAPQTVMEAIRSVPLHAALGWSDQNLVIQPTADPVSAVATHFPCCSIREDERLIISKREEEAEEAREKRNVPPEESCSVFYIDADGARNTQTEGLLISSQSQGLSPLCVYGEKDVTAAEALERDGRFRALGSFSLIDCDDGAVLQSSDTVSVLHERKFKTELPEEKPANVPEQSKTPAASAEERKSADTASHGATAASNMAAASALIQQRGVSVLKALKDSSSDAHHEEIKKILHDQFSELKKLMESRFPADSVQKDLIMREERFGKLRQSFTKVHMLEKLISMGKLVCKVVVGDGCTGTGFVLFDNYVLTNAHLFKTCTDGDRLREDVDVHVIFNFENPLPGNPRSFKVDDGVIYSTEDELDYAVLKVESLKYFLQNTRFPSGLLERVEQTPKNGEVCIIGHPEGDVKQIDVTSIIEIEKREQAAKESLSQYKDELRSLLDDQVKKAGIKRILMGGDRAEKVTTYHTFMYHGASGSPVFDADGLLCGLHTSGFFYGFPKATESVIEFAYPMKTIITHLVKKLRDKNETELLERMKTAAGKNFVLKKIFDSLDQSV